LTYLSIFAALDVDVELGLTSHQHIIGHIRAERPVISVKALKKDSRPWSALLSKRSKYQKFESCIWSV